MVFLITFLEGLLSFLSPCMLPLLPVYLSFFAGGTRENRAGPVRVLTFILGFTLSFMALGFLISAAGALLSARQGLVNGVCGGAMILFGLSYLEVFHLPLPAGNGTRLRAFDTAAAFLFGLLYPVNLTPCVGAFLGSALALAASSGSAAKGAALLLAYALGLGIPFFLSASLIGRLDTWFRTVKAHYAVVTRASGAFLIAAGILTACGAFQRWAGLFA